MKNILLIFISILLLSGCNQINKLENENNPEGKGFDLHITKTENCNNQVKEYYTNQDRTVYFVCLDEIYLIRDTAKDMTLKFHFQNVNQTFDDSIKQLVSDITDIDYLKDGGTKIYNHNEYTIIVCNTIDRNKDIYIGDTHLEYQEEYCK